MAKSPSSLDDVIAAGMRHKSVAVGGSSAELIGDAVYSHGKTMDAWERFLSLKDGTGTSTSVRRAIEQSWLRSLKSGVDARGRGSTQIIPRADVERLRIENDDLLASARETFLRIAQTLGEVATMAVITDGKGVILDVGGDPKTIDDAHDIRLEIGAAWNEGHTGTNGIGTALATGQVIYVHAAEHFCEGVKAWACVGAPIRSPVDGSIIGIVDFSGPHDIFHRHNVALAMMSANHIELALTEKIRTERMQLLEASLRKMPRIGVGDGLIVVDRFGRIVHQNDAAACNLRSLRPTGSPANGDRLLDLSGTVSATNLEESLPEEIRDHSVVPLAINGNVRGAMLVFGTKTRGESSLRRHHPSASPAGSSGSHLRAAIVGRSPVLLEAISRAERAANGRTSILLEGETGVGKELFARLIHKVSFPSDKEPFVAFNCGAVSKELIGSELFGHAPGAFTGATREGRPGRFEAAHGGTLSLDEIGEMPLELQSYVLRALEEGAIYRLGESKLRLVNVRLIASTNRNLRTEVSEGRFRKDLYFRISAVKITIPPLRQRAEDVDYLIHHFSLFFAEKYAVVPVEYTPDCMDLLKRYDWPGNVRELRNLVESTTLMSSGSPIGIDDLSEDIKTTVGSGALTQRERAVEHQSNNEPSHAPQTHHESTTLDGNERRMIELAITKANGNILLAAQRLGVARSTIYRKLKQYRSLI